MNHKPRSIFLITSLIFFALFTSGCIPTKTASPTPTSTSALTPNSAEITGFTTLTGTLTSQGSHFLLQTTDRIVSVQSLEIDLKAYTGKKVKVTGKYSGDDLFASEISEE